jgi:hypothetical protein
MGEPAVPTPEQHDERRALAHAIVDSVRNDQEFPIDLKASTHSPEIIEGIVLGLAQEITTLAPANSSRSYDDEFEDAETPPTRRRIIGIVSDMIGKFLYYDRKEDEDLPRGAIQDAIARGEITSDEIVAMFRAYLEQGLGC